MNNIKYLDKDYKKIYLSLNNEQKVVFDNFIKEGYRTRWAYIFAKNKGLLVDEKELIDGENTTINQLEEKIEWNLINYTDHLEVNKEVRCECGKALRHEYTIQHVDSGKIQTLGIIHLGQHMNISEEDVKEIKRDFRSIDNEKKEILRKFAEKRDMDITRRIKKDSILPKDMIKQVEVGLPLLDRQIKRLEKLYLIFKTDKLFSEDIDFKNSRNTLKIPDENISFLRIMNKLESGKLSIEESEKYLDYIKYYKKSIDSDMIDEEIVDKKINRILGRLRPGKLRSNLVEIQSALKRIISNKLRK